MITVDVPGKVYIAGEYAVLEPGGTAVLVAVDRYLTVSLTPAEGSARRTIATARTGEHRVELTRCGTRSVPADGDSATADALRHVLTAVDLVECYAREQGSGPLGFHLEIRSQLDDHSTGRKFGLGSSGAVTVGVVRALTQAYRFDLDDQSLLRLALLTTFTVDPRCSGGDVAASLLGGWVAYRAPDRSRLAQIVARSGTRLTDLLAEPWDHLSARRVPAPRRMRLEVGWTRHPAVSSDLVELLRHNAIGDGPVFRRFVADSNACVATLIAALESGDDASAVAAVAAAGALLRTVSARAGVVVETTELAALRHAAEAVGAVAKSSGAGGGDCGIALITPTRAAKLHQRWRAVGILPLELEVHQPFSGKGKDQ
ncbi:phosphomevalonate kinase [Nocardia arthritidis]|uniref:phosphomevalonate kinase n=1 Tax=Nocardia arthritidis TaxID=228602 RepID=A0A6G9Y6B1_9NOCA|nr:phosphomevalonate kinase [Nocardia arthritidis]QIS08785.1 phosphomevalonate kinase [Nocardia arthritidis]